MCLQFLRINLFETLYLHQTSTNCLSIKYFLFPFQLKLYNTVIDDVIAGVRDAFLDDGVDEQVLQEMKQVWTGKLMASKAVETNPDPSENSGIMSNSAKSASQSKVG